EELGVPYDLVRLRLDAGDTKRTEYLAVNPNGTVPTLVDGDLTVYESAAICQYLADQFPARRLAPPIGTPARGLYYQWIQYAACTVEPPAVAIFMHTVRLPEAERSAQVVKENQARLGVALGVVERALAGREFMLG